VESVPRRGGDNCPTRELSCVAVNSKEWEGIQLEAASPWEKGG
jgi:hypothetical protein